MTEITRDPLYNLIQALQRHGNFDHEVRMFEIIETHISYILLTGPFAYKFKKPVNLGFLDFSSLRKRHYFCLEELRLNRRLAPNLYLDVVPITGAATQPVINGRGEVIEYALRMVQFSPGHELDKVLERGDLTTIHIAELTVRLYEFHRHAEQATMQHPYGAPATVRRYALENFVPITAAIRDDEHYCKVVAALKTWTQSEAERLKPAFLQRKRNGFIRECHGDLHLGNIALHDGEILIFDCIEFSPLLRWIDTLSECAFLYMDLQARDRPGQAQCFLNDYLELSGDYAGVELLRFYLVYRALVRCKVSCIRLEQQGLDPAARQLEFDHCRRYLDLADSYTRPAQPALIITHGLSGSGKTSCSQPLLERLTAFRVRSDVERKRLHGLDPAERSGSAIEDGIYSAADSVNTYARLAQLAQQILAAGYSVIIDATFLRQSQRQPFRQLAAAVDIPFIILDFQADIALLRERIQRRSQEGRDASEADLGVLERQLESREPLDPAEQAFSIVIDTTRNPDYEDLCLRLKQLQTQRQA